MAVGPILAVLSNVPWGQVIDAAPKVADGATKLWNTVRGRKQEETAAIRSVDAQDPLRAAQAQIAGLQASVAGLQEEMRAATELIKSLAEQNTALIQRVEVNRRKLQRQTMALVVVCCVLALALGTLLLAP